jgi:hypothetical protein
MVPLDSNFVAAEQVGHQTLHDPRLMEKIMHILKHPAAGTLLFDCTSVDMHQRICKNFNVRTGPSSH